MRCVDQGKTLLQKRTDIWECKHQNKREVNWFAEFCEMELVWDAYFENGNEHTI